MSSFDDIFGTHRHSRLRRLVLKSFQRPPRGYTPIPNSKHGGYHKQVGGRWSTWYPDTGVGPHVKERFEHLINHVADHSESRMIAHHGDGTRTEVITRGDSSGQRSQHVVRWHADGSHTVYPATKVTPSHIEGVNHVTVHHVDGTRTTEPAQEAPYREQKSFTKHFQHIGGRVRRRLTVYEADGGSSERNDSEDPQPFAITHHANGEVTRHRSEERFPPEMERHYDSIRESAKGHWALSDYELSRLHGDYAANVKPHDIRVADEAAKLVGPSDTLASPEEQDSARRAARRARARLAKTLGTAKQAAAEHAYNLAEARSSVASHGARGALLHHVDEAHRASVFHDWETKGHETQAAYILALHPELSRYHDALHERNYADAKHAERHGLHARGAAEVDASHRRIKADAESVRSKEQATGFHQWWEKIKTAASQDFGFKSLAGGQGEFDAIFGV